MSRRLYHSITFKQVCAVLVATIPVVALMAASVWSSVGHGFDGYVQALELQGSLPAVASLEQAYAVAGNWDPIPREPHLFHDWLEERLGASPPPPPVTEGRPNPPPPPPEHGRIDRRMGLLDTSGRLIVGPPGTENGTARLAIRHDGTVVGYVTLAGLGDVSSAITRQYVVEQRDNLIVIGLLAVALSLLSGWLMARHLLRPITVLADGTHRLAEGAFDTRLPENRRDELGDLARSFNRLGEALAEQGNSRRQWVANTSHELRTPIAVLRAQIEAIQDGIHHSDGKTLGVLHGEVMGLSRLVDDLYTLARADVGQLRIELLPVEPIAILEDVLEGFASRLNAVGLTVELAGVPDQSWISLGDQNRLRQLFINLVENSVRYTDEGGRLAVRVAAKPNTLVLRFDDTAPGVAEDDLSRLFERFFRVEESRNREQGGSGLGLPICRSIVEAHGGRIDAIGSPLGGLRIEIVLPKREEK